MLGKVSYQFHIERITLRTRANQIKNLKDMVIRQADQPKEIGPFKKLLEDKENELKSLQSIMKIPDYDPHILMQGFERREEIEKQLHEMKIFVQLKEEEFKRKHNQLEVFKNEF